MKNNQFMKSIKPTDSSRSTASSESISSTESTESTKRKKPAKIPIKKLKNFENTGLIKRIIIILLSLTTWYFLYSNIRFISEWLVFDLLKFDVSNKLGNAVVFFLYDTPKVFLLLVLVIFAVGIIRSFFTPDRTKKLLSGKYEFFGNVLASILGVVTPFCTCSAVPLFIGFLEAGVPLGVTFSFLVSAPLVNEIALVLLFELFGWKVALIYGITGLLIAIVSGWIIGKLKVEHLVENWVYDITSIPEKL